MECLCFVWASIMSRRRDMNWRFLSVGRSGRASQLFFSLPLLFCWFQLRKRCCCLVWLMCPQRFGRGLLWKEMKPVDENINTLFSSRFSWIALQGDCAGAFAVVNSISFFEALWRTIEALKNQLVINNFVAPSAMTYFEWSLSRDWSILLDALLQSTAFSLA